MPFLEVVRLLHSDLVSLPETFRSRFAFFASQPLHFCVRTHDFDYDLPQELIAQAPVPRRDQSRLLVFRRPEGTLAHRRFPDLLEYLAPGDLLVLNNSKVIPARLRGVNSRTGGQFEVLLLEENRRNDWWVMLRPGKRARLQTQIQFKNRDGQLTGVKAMVVEMNSEGHRRLHFTGTDDVSNELARLGETPLPPYIKRTAARETDRERYQTVYAEVAGSVAAPTAGLHFTAELLAQIQARGVEICHVTLHVGLGTFAPVKAANVEEHVMHEERFELAPETAHRINEAKNVGRRIIAVGTTTVRVLESVAAAGHGRLQPGPGRTRLFITPPWQFQAVDALVTNCHLPCSSLLMLVSAFATPGETRGRELLLSAYAEAIRERYRFFSYGDAMLVL